MAVNYFYANKNVAALGTDITFRSYDMYISKWVFQGTATYETTGTKFDGFSPSTTFVANAFQSLFGKKNFFFIDDGGFLCSVPVDSNTASEVVVTIANAKRVSDGTTVAVVTDEATYQCYILSPTVAAGDGAAYGDFFGYTILSELAPNVEKVPFLTGVPEIQVREDIAAIKPSLKGTSQNLGTVHYQNLLNMVQFGLQTGQSAYYLGTDYSIGPYWEINLRGKNVNDKVISYHFWKCNLSVDGSIPLGEKGYKTAPFSASILRNEFVEDEQANMLGVITAA